MTDAVRVVLVHGLWYGRPSMLPLARRLARAGMQSRLFGYASVFAPPQVNAQRLAAFARLIDCKRLHFVGHSLGGLLILSMLAQHSRELPSGRIALLGTPLNGSAVARRMADHAATARMLGHARELLLPGWRALPEDRPTLMIAGVSKKGLGQVLEPLASPHDGTVGRNETQHPGLTAHESLPVSHTGMLFSAEVAECVKKFLSQAY